MKDIHIDVKHCAECGCDRGGIVDLNEKKPVLRCFKCAGSRKVNDVGTISQQQRHVERV